LRPPAADRPLRPWLSRVATGFAAKWRRSVERRRRHEEIAARRRDLVQPSTADIAETAELLRLLLVEVGQLEAPLREVVMGSCMQGLSSPEVAARLGVP